MPGGYQLMLNGQPADQDLYTALSSVEVEESMDMPAAVQLNLPVNRSKNGDLTYISDGRFMPLIGLSVITTTGGGSGAAGAIGGARASTGFPGRLRPKRRSQINKQKRSDKDQERACFPDS